MSWQNRAIEPTFTAAMAGRFPSTSDSQKSGWIPWVDSGILASIGRYDLRTEGEKDGMGAITHIDDNQRGVNFLAVLALTAAILFSAFWEGYLPAISPLLWFLLAAGFALSIWLASFITPRRLLALILVIFVMEYAKETIGIRAGYWSYSHSGYLFGVLMWVLAGLSAITLALGLIIPFLRALNLSIPRPLLAVFPLAFALVILLTLPAPPAPGAALAFCGFYLFLTAIVLLMMRSGGFEIMAAVTASSLALGLPCEYAGSAGGAIWSFCAPGPGQGSAGVSCLPPFFLLAGCWPLEMLAQFAIGAWVSGEKMEKYTEEEQEEGMMGAMLTGRERSFRWFMAISGGVYFVAGFIFLLSPELVFMLAQRVNHLFFARFGWQDLVLEGGKFWLALSFSMMMTITVLSLIVAIEPRRDRHFTLPLLVAKAASAICGLALFAVDNYFAYLLIFLVDGSIFGATLAFFLMAYTEGARQKASHSRHGAEVAGAARPEADPAHWKPGHGWMMGGGPCKVVVETGADKFHTLEKALEKSGFFQALDHHHQASGAPKEKFRVVIKPNFMFLHHKKDVSTYTDPELVERLIKMIHERGFTNIAIVESQSALGNYFTNRDVKTVAEYAGYGKDPAMAAMYKVVDLTEERVAFDYSGPLGAHTVGPTWRDAHFRVSFAKNKTHVFCNYTLTLKNIYGTLPEQNKLLEYHTKREYDWPTIESLKHFPVHFGLIDAIISADGQFGVITDPTPRQTNTIIAGESLLAVDWVGARKMDLDPDDPSIGRFLPLASKAFGPPLFFWEGDRSLYHPWENVSDVFIKSLDLVEEAYAFSDFFFSGLSAADGDLFKYKVTAWPNLLLRHLLKPFKRWYFKHDDLGS
ncbi:MAG: DUF362 domain-containing protein [Nitrospinota bacterium]|nr:DUF362 domain-containing protein [Nitrospinota bacterium]